MYNNENKESSDNVFCYEKKKNQMNMPNYVFNNHYNYKTSNKMFEKQLVHKKINKNILQQILHYKYFDGHVAFIITTNNNKIIFEGKSRPIGNYNDFYGICSLHAEKVVLENLKNDYNTYNLLVFRWNKHGKLTLSKPCQNCMKCIKKKNINKIYYSVENGLTYQLSKEMNISECCVSGGFRRQIKNKKN
jgi:tRNA(Arg) A34 adenosine deaminase TadA